MLRSNGSAVITVEGISMLPTLQEGDTITLSKSYNYELGDILVFAYPTEEFGKQKTPFIVRATMLFDWRKYLLTRFMGKLLW